MAVDPNSLTTLTNLQSYLGIAAAIDETILEKSIDRASALIESILGRPIKSRDLYEWHDSAGTDQLGVKVRPINHVKFVAFGAQNALSVSATPGSTDILATVEVTPTHVRLYRLDSDGVEHTTQVQFTNHQTVEELATEIAATTGFDATALGDYSAYQLHPRAGVNVLVTTAYLSAAWDTSADLRVDHEAGIISFVGDSWPSDNWTTEFPAEYRSVLVAYNGGHDVVPFDIEQACLEAAAAMYRDRKKDLGVTSESLGDYSYSVAATGRLVQQIKGMLGSRVRIR